MSIATAENAAVPLLAVAQHPGRYDSSWLLAQARRVCDEQPRFPVWVQFLAWTSVSSAANAVFFRGNWANVLLTFVASICSFLASALVPIFLPKATFSAGLLGGFIAGFVIKAALSLSLVDLACVQGVAVASIIGLVPGTGITLGVLDIIQANLVSGAARLIGALVQAALQGLGLVVGWNVAAWYQPPVPPPDAVCPDAISAWFLFLLCPMIWFGWCVLLDCPLRRWPFYWFSSLVSILVSFFLKRAPSALPAYAPTLMSSIVIGVYGAVFARLSGLPSFGVVLVGVYSLLPGGTSVWSAVLTITDRAEAYGTSTLETALYIAAGLALANVAYTKCACSCCGRQPKQEPDPEEKLEQDIEMAVRGAHGSEWRLAANSALLRSTKRALAVLMK